MQRMSGLALPSANAGASSIMIARSFLQNMLQPNVIDWSSIGT